MCRLREHRTHLSSLLIAFAFANGCGEQARNDDAQPSTRAERVDAAARSSCDRHEVCGNIGDGERYGTYDECEEELGDWYAGLWPQSRCGDDGFDDSRYAQCRSTAAQAPCDAAIVELVTYLDDCRAGTVCLD